jgi:hypothetical protein
VHHEHLHRALFLQLLQSLLKLLLPRGLLRAQRGEVLRREARDAVELHGRAGGDGVADLEQTGVHEADDVAGKRALDGLALAREEAVRARHAHVASEAGVVDGHVLFEDARGDAHEGQAIAMAFVHVRLDLEHEAGEVLVGRRELEVGAVRLRVTR